jgi:hypothetical protein
LIANGRALIGVNAGKQRHREIVAGTGARRGTAAGPVN